MAVEGMFLSPHYVPTSPSSYEALKVCKMYHISGPYFRSLVEGFEQVKAMRHLKRLYFP
jgi:hypothetical protein